MNIKQSNENNFNKYQSLIDFGNTSSSYSKRTVLYDFWGTEIKLSEREKHYKYIAYFTNFTKGGFLYDIPDCWDDDFWCSDIYLMLSIKLAMSHTFFWLSILNHYLLEASMRSAFPTFFGR